MDEIKSFADCEAQAAKDGPLPADWPDIKPLPKPGSEDRAEYPFEALPLSLQTAAKEVARFTKTPIESPAMIGISVLAAAIGKKACVQERPGLRHNPALAFVGVAESGERKSPPFRLMQLPMENWIKARDVEYKEAEKKYKANCMVVDARIGKLKKDAALAEDQLSREKLQKAIEMMERERTPKPIDPRMFTSDATEERLFQKMHMHNGEFAVFSGEGRPILDNIMGKYSGKDRTGDAIYLAGISGDTITRDRVGGDGGPEGRVIYNPCLNVCVMVQPDKYMEVARHPALRSSGAIARIWPSALPSMVGHRMEKKGEPGLNINLLTTYENAVVSCLDSPIKIDVTTHEQVPHVCALSAEAQEARRVVHNEIEALMRNDGDLADVRDIASKAVSQFCKLAMVLHLASEPSLLKSNNSVIDDSMWLSAQTLGMFHLQEAVRLQRMADESKEADIARRIISWVKTKEYKEIITSIVCQYLPRPRPTAKQADDILDLLVDHGYLMEWKVAGKRKSVFKVNPALFSQLANLAA